MIPNDCLLDFFETCVEPAVRSSKWAGLSASELIAEWLGAPRVLRAAVGTPVFDFLRNGGCRAENLVDCAVAIARAIDTRKGCCLTVTFLGCREGSSMPTSDG